MSEKLQLSGDHASLTRSPAMSHNTFGHLFRVTTFGESHGPAIGCVVDGCPPGIPLTEADIQHLSRRAAAGQVALHHAAAGSRSGQNPLRRVRHTTGRSDHRHADRSLIENDDQRSKDYDEIKDKFRPGHADLHL